jgi:hypothetical protein
VARLHDAVSDLVLFQTLAGLVAQHNAIKNHGRPAALLLGGVQQSDGNFCLAEARWANQNLSTVASGEPLAEHLYGPKLGLS